MRSSFPWGASGPMSRSPMRLGSSHRRRPAISLAIRSMLTAGCTWGKYPSPRGVLLLQSLDLIEFIFQSLDSKWLTRKAFYQKELGPAISAGPFLCCFKYSERDETNLQLISCLF